MGKSDTHHFFRTVNASTQETELWATDGSGANTVKVLQGYSINFYEGVGSNFMFAANNQANNSNSLWSSNGTVMETYKVKEFGSQSVRGFNKFNDKLIFGVSGNTWISDGTEAGTLHLTTGAVDTGVTIGNYFYGLGRDFSAGFYRMMKTDGNAVEIFNMSDADATV